MHDLQSPQNELGLDDIQQLRFGNNPFVDTKKAQYTFRTVCLYNEPPPDGMTGGKVNRVKGISNIPLFVCFLHHHRQKDTTETGIAQPAEFPL